MSLPEFELIQRFFADQSNLPVSRTDVRLGIGDDAAIVAPSADKELVITVDTLVSGVHFDPALSADQIARQSLVVNLSDLAAMGAEPAWFTLALTLPESDSAWLENFSQGLFETARQYGIALIGGDTTRGPLAITIQAHGFVSAGAALRRDGAGEGDVIYVSGDLGGPRGALELWRSDQGASSHALIERWHNPQPRLALGQQLVGMASAALDISDGLVADLGHILKRSAKGAVVNLTELPLHPALTEVFPLARAQEFALCGGDDYELCFTVPATAITQVQAAANTAGVNITAIGEITAAGGLQVRDEAGSPVRIHDAGYQHFGSSPAQNGLNQGKPVAI